MEIEKKEMKFSSRYFSNKSCEYYPCHKGAKENFNCLFCYCPLYRIENCPGTPSYLEKNGRRIKDCTTCTFPHNPNNYDLVMSILKENK